MVYDYRDEKVVQDAIFEDFDALMEDVFDEYDGLRRYEALKIFAPAWIAANIIVRFVENVNDVHFYEETNLEILENENNEILLEFCYDGCIFIEEARGNNGQFLRGDDNTLNYMYDSFPKRDIDYFALDQEHILVFGFEDEDALLDEYNAVDEDVNTYYEHYDLPSEVTNISNKKVNGKVNIVVNDTEDGMHGFTATESGDGYNMSYSFYSSEKLDMNDTMRILKMMGFGK